MCAGTEVLLVELQRRPVGHSPAVQPWQQELQLFVRIQPWQHQSLGHSQALLRSAGAEHPVGCSQGAALWEELLFRSHCSCQVAEQGVKVLTLLADLNLISTL